MKNFLTIVATITENTLEELVNIVKGTIEKYRVKDMGSPFLNWLRNLAYSFCWQQYLVLVIGLLLVLVVWLTKVVK